MRCSTFGMLILFAHTACGETPDQLRNQLEAAVSATGTVYIVARNELVNLGSNAVPELAAISANTNEDWHLRLMAGIVVERIERGSEITALAQKNWRADPEYNTNWDRICGGPGAGLAPLVTKRCHEMALWWHYVELTWKETREHSMGDIMEEDIWRAVYRTACEQSPVYGLLVKVLEERIRSDIGFNNQERKAEFYFLRKSTNNTSLPFLLEMIPQVPWTDDQRQSMMFEILKNMAQPEDVPLIEQHFRDKGQAVPELFREPLQILKERQKRNTTVP